MADHIHIRIGHDGTVDNRAIRDALGGLTGDDVSVSSPVRPRGSNLGTYHGDGESHVTQEDGDGDWTKTSEQAVVSALSMMDGVEEVEVVEGGYDADDTADDGDDSGGDETTDSGGEDAGDADE